MLLRLRPWIANSLPTSMILMKMPCHRSVVPAGFIYGGANPAPVTPPDHKLVSSICHFLRTGCNWDTLSSHFRSLPLTASLVDQVLLQLKEPSDAKLALSFFHLSSSPRTFNLVLPLHSHCLMLHILVRARRLVDARAIVLSILRKFHVDSSKFLVVDSLLGTYSLTLSTPFVFDFLVQAYAKTRMLEVGFHVCYYLQEHGFSLSLVTFNSLIHVVQTSDKTHLVWPIYEHMLQQRIYPNQATIRSMISGLCKEGKLQTFVDLLDRIHGKRCSPLVIVNTCLVYSILEEGRIEVGMALLKTMLRKNMLIDTVAYSLIVFARLQLGHLDSAVQVYEEMLKRGFNANLFLYTSFIGSYCKLGRIGEAKQLLQEMENAGLKPYGDTFNFIIHGCAKEERAEEGLRYCEKMLEKGLVPCLSYFNDMVAKLHGIGDVKKANAILTCALDKGFVPNELTYSLLMTGYEKENQLQEVLKLYYEMEFRSLSPGLVAFTALIRTHCHCGMVEEAEKYLRIAKDRSLNPCEESYEALIRSHFQSGNETRALQLYNEMTCRGLKPCCSDIFSSSPKKC